MIEFLNTHSKNLTKKQIEKIDILNDDVAAILLENCINYITKEQINKIDLKSHLLIKKLKSKNLTPILILRRYQRFKDLSTDQFNSLNYKIIGIVNEILIENLQNQITENNLQKIKLSHITNKERLLKFFQSCASKFSMKQIQKLNSLDSDILQIIFEKDIHHKLSK